MADIVNFNQKTVQQLLTQIEATNRPKPGYHNLPLAEIDAYVAFTRGDETLPAGVVDAIVEPFEAFQQFLKLLGTPINEAAIASYKVGADGGVEKFFGPALFRKEDEVVLRVGSEFIPVEVFNNNRIRVGKLSGKITFKTYTTNDESYTRGSVVLKSAEVDTPFGISARLTEDATEVADFSLDDDLDTGNIALVDILQTPGSGASKYLKLADLELDQSYTVIGIDCGGKVEYGRHRPIILVEGAEKVVNANTELKTTLDTYASQLEKAKAYSPEAMNTRFKGYKLTVTKKQQFKNDRWKCSVRFTPKTTMAGFKGSKPAATVEPAGTVAEVPF